MGRPTRSSSGGPKVPTGGYYQSSGGRKTLITTSTKRGLVNGVSGIPVCQPPTQTTVFDFPKEVTFEYTPRQNGFGTVLEFMKRGDESVKDKILNECNVIIECRVCTNLFRSPRDFITHKDKHCCEKYQCISPVGLTELLRLARDSFKVNIESEASNSTVSDLPTVCDSHDKGGLTFDVNHLIPMMNLTLNPSQTSNQESSAHLKLKELELLTKTGSHAADGVERTTRQIPHDRNGDLKPKGKYKSKPKDNAALLGVDGKAVVVGKSTSIQAIVDQLAAQWETRKDEVYTKESMLKCSTCQILCPSEKALRIHARRDHQQISEKAKKRKMTDAINGISSELEVMLIRESKQHVIPSKSTTVKSRRQATPKKLKLSYSGDTKKETPETSNSTTKEKLNKKLVTAKASAMENPARVSTFRRLTNNSFSATFGNSSESDPILSLNESELIRFSPKKPKKSNDGFSSLSTEKTEENFQDYKAIAKALFNQTSRKGRKSNRTKKSCVITTLLPSVPQPPRDISCLKCTAKFATEKDMSIHLGNCSSHNTTQRISILERQDYMKPLNSSEDPLILKPMTSIIPSFNNNENEVEAEEAERSSVIEEKLENEIFKPCSCPLLEDPYFIHLVTPPRNASNCEGEPSIFPLTSEKMEEPITVIPEQVSPNAHV